MAPHEVPMGVARSAAPIDFVSLGMLIIDEIEYEPPRPPERDVLGGAGTYAALGARLLSPGPLSTSVGWVVDKGSDFPPSLTTLIDSWQTGAVCRADPSRLTTRGWNSYADSGNNRAFRYTTPKKRLTAADLTPPLLLSRSFHLICSPARCQELVADITARRKALCPPHAYSRPVFCWEPVPDLCTPDELLNCTNTLPLVDVCTPNHAELAGFMGDDGLDPDTGQVSPAAVERYCEQLLASMPLQSYTLVVRAADRGCYLARNGGRKRAPAGAAAGPTASSIAPKRRKKEYVRGGLRPDTDMEALFAGLLQGPDGVVARQEIEIDPGLERWVPAYHADPARVVDATGGGNCFVGALAVSMARGASVEEAAVFASAAASFAIEQVGVPVPGVDDCGNETWNGVSVQRRIDELRSRLR